LLVGVRWGGKTARAMRGFQRMRDGVSAVAIVQRSTHGAFVGMVPHHSAAGAAQRDAGSRPANMVYPASRLLLQARWMCPSWSEQQARFMSIDKYSLFGGDEAADQRTSVDSYNKHGFMVNSVLIQGAVILLPETTLLWNVTKMEDITSESLIALRLLLTKPGSHHFWPDLCTMHRMHVFPRACMHACE